MKIALDQRLGTTMKTDWKALEWMVELSAVLINRCLVGHDGKTPYSRLMGKNSSKELVEFGERVLAKVTRCHTSTWKQALMSRWEDAIWVGVAKKCPMNILSCARVEDQQLGVGLSSGGRSQADGVPKRLQRSRHHRGNRALRHRREDLLRQRKRSA